MIFPAAQIISQTIQCISQFCVLLTQTLQKSDFNHLKKNSQILLVEKIFVDEYIWGWFLY